MRTVVGEQDTAHYFFFFLLFADASVIVNGALPVGILPLLNATITLPGAAMYLAGTEAVN